MVTNPMLLALLESSKPPVTYINEAAKDEEETDAGAEDQAADAEEDAAEDPPAEEPKKEEEDTENSDEDQSEDDSSDEFSFDSDEEGDDEPNPDGLPDPDDTGSDTSDDDPEEKNVQTNILNLSTLDRHLIKRRLFNSFKDLRSSINSFRMTIDERAEALVPEVRNEVINVLGDLYEKLTEYLMYKFSYINYEENLENFLLYTKKFNEIIQVTTSDLKHDNKSARKKSSNKEKR